MGTSKQAWHSKPNSILD